MLMKKTIHYMTLFVILLFMNCLTTSCIKDDYTATDGTSTINLYFSTRSDEADTGDTQETTIPVGTNEGIKTLRVFITDENGKVQCNIYQDYSNDFQGNNAVKTFTIMGVPVGIKNFYVIANEASVGLTKNDLDNRQMVDEDFLNTVITNPSSPSVAYFPRMRNQINELGLPITGMKTGVLVEGEKLDLEIPITHAVAKIVLNITNNMTENFWVNQVLLGAFIADQTYLFPKQGSYQTGKLREHTITATTQGFYVTSGENSEAFVLYIYETGKNASISDFSIGLGSPTVPELKEMQSFFLNRNYLNRNEVLVINATVNIDHTVPEITWKYEVAPWTNVPVGVPSFN